MINNKLKNCCNDCVYCEIVTETKRRAIPEDKTEVVLVNTYVCMWQVPERGAGWKIEACVVQDARTHSTTEGLCTALRITARD